MNNEQQARRIASLISTSVDDCKTSLLNENDPRLLCDLLIECHNIGHGTRENYVRQRISKLIKGKVK